MTSGYSCAFVDTGKTPFSSNHGWPLRFLYVMPRHLTRLLHYQTRNLFLIRRFIQQRLLASFIMVL